MKIDRAAFLALATSLAAATGCATSDADDGVSNEEAAISAGGSELCYSADESTGDGAAMFWHGQIGFDPVHDFPAAEGFCFDVSLTGDENPDGTLDYDEFIYDKCNAYGKVYVPHVVFTSYDFLTKNLRQDMHTMEKWAVLYALDSRIEAEDFFCVTPADESVCSDVPDRGACLRASTQMVPESKELLAVCLRQHWDVHGCVEGASRLLLPFQW